METLYYFVIDIGDNICQPTQAFARFHLQALAWCVLWFTELCKAFHSQTALSSGTFHKEWAR